MFYSSENVKIRKSNELTEKSINDAIFNNELLVEQSSVVIEIQNEPTIRLVRNVSFTRLDFIVSIGGIIGLFFGASILGLVEIIYIWMIRKFNNVDLN